MLSFYQYKNQVMPQFIHWTFKTHKNLQQLQSHTLYSSSESSSKAFWELDLDDVQRNPISTSRLVPDSRLVMLEGEKRNKVQLQHLQTCNWTSEARDVIGRVNYLHHVMLKRENGLSALLPFIHCKHSSIALLPQERTVYPLHVKYCMQMVFTV